MASPQRLFVCDSCDEEMDGWLKRELEDEKGWKFYRMPKGEFAMCDNCVRHYEKRWGK